MGTSEQLNNLILEISQSMKNGQELVLVCKPRDKLQTTTDIKVEPRTQNIRRLGEHETSEWEPEWMLTWRISETEWAHSATPVLQCLGSRQIFSLRHHLANPISKRHQPANPVSMRHTAWYNRANYWYFYTIIILTFFYHRLFYTMISRTRSPYT